MAGVFKPDLKELALRLYADGPVRVLSTPKRVRILFNKAYIADTTKAQYVWEHPYYPQYYLPKSAFDSSKISEGEKIQSEEGKHVATVWNIEVNERTTDRIICFADNLDGKARELSGLVKANFADMDQWFEEDIPIFVHPKDPFKRVDCITSTRPVKVEIGGHKVAEAVTSVHLYETGLPVRYYLPLTAVNPAVLTKSDKRTQCPYKGEAEYYNVSVGGELYKDIVWYYDRPTMECATVTGLCCFYNEKVDISIQTDGRWEKLERPKTPFS